MIQPRGRSSLGEAQTLPLALVALPSLNGRAKPSGDVSFFRLRIATKHEGLREANADSQGEGLAAAVCVLQQIPRDVAEELNIGGSWLCHCGVSRELSNPSLPWTPIALFAETPHTHPLCRDAVAAADEWQQHQRSIQHPQQDTQHKQQQHVPRRQQQGRLKASGVGGFVAEGAWSPRDVFFVGLLVDRPFLMLLLLSHVVLMLVAARLCILRHSNNNPDSLVSRWWIRASTECSKLCCCLSMFFKKNKGRRRSEGRNRIQREIIRG